VGLRQCYNGDVRTFRVLEDKENIDIDMLFTYRYVVLFTVVKLRQHMYNVLQYCVVLTSVNV
jgi:hypothetical protein